MVFSNLIFLGVFLPIVLLLYFTIYKINGKLQWLNYILLVASLFFYAWGEPVWVFVLVLTATMDYINGRRIANTTSQGKRRVILYTSVVLDLGLLFCMKYLGFAVSTINGVLATNISVPEIVMPIGISFYTFQSLSYLLDLYRGKVEVQHRYSNYVLYIAMFPQLVAGPIVRYADVAEQLNNRELTIDGFGQGASRFICGLAKKVILANYAGEAASILLDGNLDAISMPGAWFGIILYAFQIYFDFSGYSDMAIGMGRMFGFVYNENFRYPYLSGSITDFWRRWHISLGLFFRDYVYIPLGGNRHNQLRNILIVWGLTGLWHGAGWNFVCWGLYYGIVLLIEKKFLLPILKRHKLLGWCYTAVLVLLGWALFYYTDLSRFILFAHAFFGIGTALALDLYTISVFWQYFWLLPIFVAACTPYPRRFFIGLNMRWSGGKILQALALVLLGVLCMVLLVGQSYNPFLYFRF